jgi:hypothetical protein
MTACRVACTGSARSFPFWLIIGKPATFAFTSALVISRLTKIFTSVAVVYYTIQAHRPRPTPIIMSANNNTANNFAFTQEQLDALSHIAVAGSDSAEYVLH